MGQQIEITDEQEKVIQLIKTWDVPNIKLALLMDDSQGLGVQELYSSFIMKWGHIYHDLDLSPEEIVFPVHSLLFYKFSERVLVPKKVKTVDQLTIFLIDYFYLIGFKPDKNNKVGVCWDDCYAGGTPAQKEGEIKHEIYKSTGTKIDFEIGLLSF